MFENKGRFVVVSAAILLLSASSMFSAETWRLGQQGDWKAVSAEGEDKYLLAVAQIKKLVNTGQTEAVGKALDKLKKDFPEIAGPDLDAFIKAEMLFSKGKFTKAVRGYDKFLEEYSESALFEAALDRQSAIATAFLAGQKRPILKVFKIKGYATGVKIMEKISDRAGLDTPIGVKAAIAVAENYEKREKFHEAYLKWEEIAFQWETGEIGGDALLGQARCKHAAYRGPKYDASNLTGPFSAKNYYENFKLQYPEDAEELEVDKILEQIEQQLAYKQFSIGEYYQKMGNKLSANLYYDMVIRDWPDSKAAEMAKKTMNENLAGEKIKK